MQRRPCHWSSWAHRVGCASGFFADLCFVVQSVLMQKSKEVYGQMDFRGSADESSWAVDKGLTSLFFAVLCFLAKSAFLKNSKELYGQANFGARRMSRFERRMEAWPYVILCFWVMREKSVFRKIPKNYMDRWSEVLGGWEVLGRQSTPTLVSFWIFVCSK